MDTFRQDMDDMQWNNAQMFNDVVDLQNIKDKQRNDIMQLQYDVDELQELAGIQWCKLNINNIFILCSLFVQVFFQFPISFP